jgi:U3 small nucleolar RNA-associated protein 10
MFSLLLLYVANIYLDHSFFGHLIDVLGSREFSAPVCMLLLEKSANRIIRQTPVDNVHASLSLPISVFQHGNYAQQIYVRDVFNLWQSIPLKNIVQDRQRDTKRDPTDCYAYY